MLDLNDSLDTTYDRPNEHILNLEYWNHDNEQGMSFVTFVTFDMVTNIDYSLYYSDFEWTLMVSSFFAQQKT